MTADDGEERAGGEGVSGTVIDVAAARERIRPFAVRTPVVAVPDLPPEGRPPILLKLESLQRTGSFKLRGAASRLRALTGAERRRGVVTCSSGNHGRAVAFVAGRLGIPATVFVPEWVDPVKLEAIRSAGAEARVEGRAYDDAEAAALRHARESGRIYVHPFDDPLVIAGQGTVGAEVVEDVPDVDTVAVPLSGGGLAAGVAAAVKAVRPGARVVGVQAERAAVMLRSLEAGRPVEVDEEETLASALAGGIDLENRHTFRLVRDLVDEIVTVPEDAIARAVRRAFLGIGLVVEGGGAVALAAVVEGRIGASNGPVVVVVSGGNVDAGVLREILATRY